jgi:hypothetical protein
MRTLDGASAIQTSLVPDAWGALKHVEGITAVIEEAKLRYGRFALSRTKLIRLQRIVELP